MLMANRSNIGSVRQVNEDQSWTGKLSTGTALAVVADGMGGHQAGDVASRMAVEAFCFAMKSNLPGDGITLPEGKMLMRQAITEANSSVYELSSREERYRHMGTTIVAALLQEANIIIGHVGDSRAYKISEGAMEQLTVDHTLVNELVKSGQLSKDEAVNHPRRNVLTRAIGTDAHVEIDVQAVKWSSCDTLLLCSDGLTNMVSENEIVGAIMNEELELEDKADHLIQLALNGGGDDNITVVLIQPSADREREERLQ